MRLAYAMFGVLFAVSWWHPPNPAEQALHHSLTIVAIVALGWAVRRYRLPDSSVVMALIFLSLHTIAARWMYSYVPYDDWADALFGVRLNDVFGWRRNHFDRLVHLAYGVCVAAVLYRQLALRRGRGWAAAIAVEVVISTSALYELFEWLVAVTLSAGAAEAYNGQQGDMWDAHRDMALALLGAVCAVAVALSRRRLRERAGG